MMKRAIFAVAVLMMAAVTAQATVTVDWQSDENGAQYVIDSGAGNLAIGSTVQLIWSADAAASAFDDNNPLVPTGGDIVLETRATTVAGYWLFGQIDYDATQAPWSGAEDDFVGGFVYQRVFDVPIASTPTAGDWYGTGSYISIALGDQDPVVGTPTPSFLFSSSGSAFDLATDGAQIVPEPATMATFGLGLLVIALRRKLKA